LNRAVTKSKLEKYFSITKEALELAGKALDPARLKEAQDFLNMSNCYYSDAQHFREKGDWVLAFAALNYAHGWLDAGARIGLFKVKDSRLFTVDSE